MNTLAMSMVAIVALSAPPVPSVRQVSVEVLADEEFRAQPGWQDRAGSMLAAVSSEFEQLFRIQFRAARYGEWQSSRDLNSIDLLTDQIERSGERGQVDLLIAFTGRDNLDDAHRGCALLRPAVVVVKGSGASAETIAYLKHEMAHVFGAVHLIDPDSIMDLLGRGSQFDEVTSRLITLNRLRRFNTPELPFQDEWLPALIRTCQSVSDSLSLARVGSLVPRLRGVPTYPSIDPELVRVHDRRPRYNAPEDVCLLLGQLYIERKQYAEARRECEKALQFNPYSPEAKNQLGIIERRTGHIDAAIAIYLEVLRSRPEEARVLYNLGIAYARKGHLSDAVAAYGRAIQAQPGLTEAHCNLGEIYLRQNEVEKAQSELLLALRSAPQFALAHSNLAEVYLKQGDTAKASEEVDRAIALKPTLAAAYNVRGNLRYAAGRLEDAAREYQHAIALDVSCEKAYFNLGNCYLGLQRAEEATRSFLKALEIDPRFAQAHAALGYCRLLNGNAGQAAAQIREAHELGFHSAHSYLNLSTALLRQDNLTEALQAAKMSVELDPRLAQAHTNLGVLYARMGEVQRSIDEFQRALSLDPRSRDAHLNLGALYLQNGDDERAFAVYREAIQLDPGNGLLHNNLAVLYFRSGQYAESSRHVQTAQSLGFPVHPDFLKQLAEKLKPQK